MFAHDQEQGFLVHNLSREIQHAVLSSVFAIQSSMINSNLIDSGSTSRNVASSMVRAMSLLQC